MNGTHAAVDLGELTIANNGQNSDSMDFTGWRGAARAITIYGPGELDGTIKVQVSEDDTNWFDLQSAGTDISIPADGAVVIGACSWKYLRVASSGAESPARTFIVKGEEGY